ncbi:MAG TPA: PVC-type heme-binding CxxCH protein [Pirellulales bacterium]|jgi:putative membrane-bound dehydrogenase-like protein
MLRRTLLLPILFALLGLGAISCADDFPTPYNSEKAAGEPMQPAEVVASAKLPPGFKMSVFAAEPDVQNPIAITTDERGRVWVLENYTWAGANLGLWDTSLRDRIVILEDTDGDGKHDKRTVFWDQGRKATSIEVGFGGVWVLNLPQLLFIPDKNRDDVPDGPPQVVLDGIDEVSVGHTPANGLKWGPDGWLYARHGIQGTSLIGRPQASDSQRVKINTGIWRYHPVHGTVQAIMHGMTNSWGFDFDEHGEMFAINTVIGHLWHVVPGAHVRRMYGTDINPHSYGLIEQTADHVHWDTGEKWGDVRKGVTDKTSAAGGGHAHIGMLIYQGDNWPEDYRGKLFALNMHGQRVNCDTLKRVGAGYTATHGSDMCFMADPWFRGMELLTLPDGGVIISDWSDTGECHDHDGVHRGSGRIYKLTYGDPRRVKSFDLARYKDEELVKLQASRSDWWARQARRIMQERCAAGEHAVTAASKPTHELRDLITSALKNERDPVRRLRLLWCASAAGAPPDENLDQDFSAIHNEHERVWRLRLAVDRFVLEGETVPATFCESLARLARAEPSGLVQLYLASALQQLPIEQHWPLASALCSHAEFASDRMLPLMVWYGIEPAVPRDPARALTLITDTKIPLLRQYASRRLTEEIERDPDSVNNLVLLADRSEPGHAEQILTGMAEALRGWSKAPQPAAWTKLAKKVESPGSAELKKLVQELGVVFGDGRAADDLRAIIVDNDAEAAARQQALRTILRGKPADLILVLHNLVGDRATALEAIRGLALYDHSDTPARILQSWHQFGPNERAAAIDTLCSRPAYAQKLMGMLRDGTIRKSELSASHARQIRSFDESHLNAQLAELWGEVRTSTAEKRSVIEQLKSKLTPDVLAEAHPSQGRALFQKHCANCHVLYGAGHKVGPDLTGSNRKNLDYLLENIVDPSASLAADFRALAVVLEDGRVLNGVITDQNERTLTLQTAEEPVTLDRKTIEETRPTANSLMPDGLLQNLSNGEVCDLVSYLISVEQVALPE